MSMNRDSPDIKIDPFLLVYKNKEINKRDVLALIGLEQTQVWLALASDRGRSLARGTLLRFVTHPLFVSVFLGHMGLSAESIQPQVDKQ